MKHILSLSYGKDSLACLEAINRLKLPLDRIVHSELMANDEIPAELPEMISFKNKADRIIKERYGYKVEHIRAKYTYEDIFYRKRIRGKNIGEIYGFPCIKKSWCISKFKLQPLKFNPNDITYLGIAIDEIERVKKHQTKTNTQLPLVEIGWTENDCYKWCEENNLLAPIYKNRKRGGCWFCHKQSVNDLRLLRKEYPKYWELLKKWDNDSPFIFKINHTVSDYDKRFKLEERGLICKNKCFRWKIIEEQRDYKNSLFPELIEECEGLCGL